MADFAPDPDKTTDFIRKLIEHDIAEHPSAILDEDSESRRIARTDLRQARLHLRKFILYLKTPDNDGRMPIESLDREALRHLAAAYDCFLRQWDLD